jgi:hypothetical protein
MTEKNTADRTPKRKFRSSASPESRSDASKPGSSAVSPEESSGCGRLAFPFLTRRFRIDERYRAYPIHLMYYSDGTLRELLEKAGWKVETTFTIGMGLDEFFIRPEKPPKPAAPWLDGNQAVSSARPKKRFRHIIRDTFLQMGLGENLAVIASPVRLWKPFFWIGWPNGQIAP